MKDLVLDHLLSVGIEEIDDDHRKLVNLFRLMLKYGYYEGIEEHKEEHQDLIDSVRELQQKYLQVGKLEEEDLKFLEHWLTEHILVADMRLGSYLIEVM
jgi:hemerythrin